MVYFWFLEKFWSEKSDWVFGLPSPRGGVGVTECIFSEWVSGFEILKVTPPPPGVVKKRYGPQAGLSHMLRWGDFPDHHPPTFWKGVLTPHHLAGHQSLMLPLPSGLQLRWEASLYLHFYQPFGLHRVAHKVKLFSEMTADFSIPRLSFSANQKKK